MTAKPTTSRRCRGSSTGSARPTPTTVSTNDFWDNALEGILIGSALADPAIDDNRIRDNGRRAQPGSSGGGDTVSYTERSLTDTSAHWRPDEHRGKWITADGQRVIVMGNTPTKLNLAPRRPGALTAWPERTPPAGAPYRIPDPPATRAGVRLSAATYRPTIQNNRIWDSQPDQTQTHGLVISTTGTCEAGWVHDNQLEGNAVGPTRFVTAPSGGCWYHNLGLDECPGERP